MKRKHYIALVGALSLVYLAVLLLYATRRGLNPDEGFYPLAARLVWEGKIPYRDFLFSQGPLIPYIYGWIAGLHPQSLVAMRFVSVALGAATVFLWGWFLFSLRSLSPGVAFWTFLVILLNPYWIAWHSIVKTFAFADFLISVAIICLYHGFQRGRARWYAGAGLALGLLASSRSLYGPVLPFTLVWLALLDWKAVERNFRRTWAYLAGVVCGAVPLLLNFAADPDTFIFDNFRYRRIIDTGLHAPTLQVLLNKIGGLELALKRPFFEVLSILVLAGIISLLELRKKKENPWSRQDYQFFLLVFLMMLVYTGTSLIPIPAWSEYFEAPLLPFLVFFIAEGLRIALRFSWKWAVVIVILGPVLCWQDVHKIVGEASGIPRLQLAAYREVTRIVRANSSPDAVVLSIWPGYVFESGRRPFPGTENQFVYPVAAGIAPELRRRYHVASKDMVLQAVVDGVPDIYIPVALRKYVYITDAEYQTFQAAVKDHYDIVGVVDEVSIYRKVR